MDKNLMKTGKSAGSQNLAKRVCAKAALRRSSAPLIDTPFPDRSARLTPLPGYGFFLYITRHARCTLVLDQPAATLFPLTANRPHVFFVPLTTT